MRSFVDDLRSKLRGEGAYLTVLCAVGAMRLINLGFLDLQAWDEALYAVRARGILLFGGIFDQTSFAIGGLYSSLHPPLYVWLTSISFLIFGVSEFAARFFSAFLGAGTILLIYRIGRDLDSPKVGFVAAMLFGLNPFVSFFARQGQFDSALVFFLTLAAYYYLRTHESRALQYAFYAGAAVGAALMTKLFVGCGIVLAYFVWKAYASEDENKRKWTSLLVSLAAAAAVALPWHVYMTIIHGHGRPLFFLEASAVLERSISGVEGNVKPLEVFYYINQLLVLFPLGIAWFVMDLRKAFGERKSGWLFLALWFLIFFVVFSLMRTKLSVYILPMLVPASLIAARSMVNYSKGQYSDKLAAVLLGATSILILWSASQDWRNLVKSIPTALLSGRFPSGSSVIQILPLFVVAACVLYLLRVLYRRGALNVVRGLTIPILLLLSFLLTFYSIVGRDQFLYDDGGCALAQFIAQRGPSTILVAGFDRNPQLTYYLDGADIGWRDDIEMTRVVPPTARSEFRSWLSQESSVLPADALVIVEKDKFIRYEWVTAEEINPVDYALVFNSRRYAVFQRVQIDQLALSSSQHHESIRGSGKE
ncbi:MAG TPA: glycosyltransferase family 39 protein [Bacteroidota bacterium]|nr:glycosyltransferase family 39 protein [Bacteroidota bacterium]